MLFATGIHDEANEEDVKSVFSEYGHVSNIAVNIDRRTGFLKVCYTKSVRCLNSIGENRATR